jgi:hypothetical protein
MTLTLQRLEFRDDGIFSVLKDDQGKVLAHCAEHAYDSLPKIYNGTFTCVRGQHQLHSGPPFSTFEITSVNGHSNLLFHAGNYPQVDSDGCSLVGQTVVDSDKGRMVTNSKATFAKLMETLLGIQTFTLVVI